MKIGCNERSELCRVGDEGEGTNEERYGTEE